MSDHVLILILVVIAAMPFAYLAFLFLLAIFVLIFGIVDSAVSSLRRRLR